MRGRREPPPEGARPGFLFATRVIRASVLHGFEVMAFWGDGEEEGAITIRARHPYGPWRHVRVFQCSGGMAESENGSPVTAPDIAMRLRRALADRPPQLHFRFREPV